MKITHAISSLADIHGGPSKACVEMANSVADAGHEVVIHTTDLKISDQNLQQHGLPNAHGVKIFYHPSKWIGPWALSSTFSEGLGRDIETSDAVHIHSLYLLHDYFAWKWCKSFSVPYLVRPHGSLNPAYRNRHQLRKFIVNQLFMNKVLADCYALHFTCQQEEILAQPAISGARGVIVPNGLHTEDYAKLPSGDRFRNLFPDPENRHIILFLGRLNFIKGLDLLAHAFAKLCRQNKNAALILAGPDGGLERDLRGWLDAENVLDQVRFTGLIKDEDKLAAFAAADLFVLPSYSENFGISAVEAMAAGLPVVVTDQVNIFREIRDDGAGLVAECDTQSLHDQLASLLADGAKRREMGIAARKSVENRYDWGKIGPQLIEVYRQMSNSGQNKG